MIKANDWLLAQGHIEKITRGRRSLENINHLMAAYEAGTRFSDWEPKETTSVTGEKRITNKVKTVGGGQIDNFNEAFIRYPGEISDYLVTDEQGNKRSLKEACNGCGYSLVGHQCTDPRIVNLNASGDSTRVTVEFKPTRKG